MMTQRPGDPVTQFHVWSTVHSTVLSELVVLVMIIFRLILVKNNINQDVLYDYRADLHGIRNRTIVM